MFAVKVIWKSPRQVSWRLLAAAMRTPAVRAWIMWVARPRLWGHLGRGTVVFAWFRYRRRSSGTSSRRDHWRVGACRSRDGLKRTSRAHARPGDWRTRGRDQRTPHSAKRVKKRGGVVAILVGHASSGITVPGSMAPAC
jgi:hypothetical protein